MYELNAAVVRLTYYILHTSKVNFADPKSAPLLMQCSHEKGFINFYQYINDRYTGSLGYLL